MTEPNNTPEPWVPTSREEWADVFALGLSRDREAQEAKAAEEAEAAAKAAAEAGNGGNGGENDNPPTRRDLGSILLGRKS